MADNTTLNSMTGGDTIGADDITSVKYQRIKLIHGADGVNDGDVSSVNPLPINYTKSATVIDTTTVLLGIGASYTSATFDHSTGGAYVTHYIYADVGGTHYAEESHDGTNWIVVDAETVTAGVVLRESHQSIARYSRARYVNGGVAQGTFYHQAVQKHIGQDEYVKISDTQNTVTGDKQHNAASPAVDAFEVIGAIANAAAPTYIEGRVVLPRVTLSGDTAVTLDGESITETNSAAIKTAVETIDNAIAGTEMQVDVVTMPSVAQATASNLNAQVVGELAHDAVDSGNPTKLGAKAVASLEAQTIVAANDRTHLYADLDGVLVTKPNTTFGDIIADRVADTAGTSAAFTNHAAGGAGVRNYVSTIAIFNSSATDGYVDFRDGAAGSIIFTAPAPKGGGCVITLPVPLRQPTANTALAYDVSAALTTVYISIVGWQSKC